MKTYIEFLESKQVGILYHFTKGNNLVKMIDDEFLQKYKLQQFELFSINGEISCTRNFCLADGVGDISKLWNYNVRIDIDATKMSNKYKIRPLLGFTNSDNPLFPSKENRERVSRLDGENEEMIMAKFNKDKNKTVKIKDYIISITISGDKELYNEVKGKLNSLGYTVNYQRKFKPIKEDVDYQVIESFYSII